MIYVPIGIEPFNKYVHYLLYTDSEANTKSLICPLKMMFLKGKRGNVDT